MGKDDDWNVDTLKEHMDKIFELHEKAVVVAFEEREKAGRVALVELNRRLDILNHAHELAKEKERDFYSRESHDIFAKQVKEDLNDIKEQVEEKTKTNWSIPLGFVTLLGLMVAGYYTQISDLKVTASDNKGEVARVAAKQEIVYGRLDNIDKRISDIDNHGTRAIVGIEESIKELQKNDTNQSNMISNIDKTLRDHETETKQLFKHQH